MLWSDAPDPDMGLELYRKLAITRAELILLKRRLTMREDEIKDEYKRNPTARRLVLADELDEQAKLEAEEVKLDLEIKFYNLRCDMYRASIYRKG
jgi:predicted Holliday junction resolvase-like endonuclease